MQNIRAINTSWLPDEKSGKAERAEHVLDLGPALLQLVVTELEHKVAARPADIVVTLAFLAGRMVQRSFFLEHPASFRIDQSANGILFLRSDMVTAKLLDMKAGTLAAQLVESAMLSGARRFPDFSTTQQEANESMQRRGKCMFSDLNLSAAPDVLAAEIQTDVNALVVNIEERPILINGLINATGLAIGYSRHRLCPVSAAELAMGSALYAGWLDQRKNSVR